MKIRNFEIIDEASSQVIHLLQMQYQQLSLMLLHSSFAKYLEQNLGLPDTINKFTLSPYQV